MFVRDCLGTSAVSNLYTDCKALRHRSCSGLFSYFGLLYKSFKSKTLHATSSCKLKSNCGWADWSWNNKGSSDELRQSTADCRIPDPTCHCSAREANQLWCNDWPEGHNILNTNNIWSADSITDHVRSYWLLRGWFFGRATNCKVIRFTKVYRFAAKGHGQAGWHQSRLVSGEVPPKAPVTTVLRTSGCLGLAKLQMSELETTWSLEAWHSTDKSWTTAERASRAAGQKSQNIRRQCIEKRFLRHTPMMPWKSNREIMQG